MIKKFKDYSNENTDIINEGKIHNIVVSCLLGILPLISPNLLKANTGNYSKEISTPLKMNTPFIENKIQNMLETITKDKKNVKDQNILEILNKLEILLENKNYSEEDLNNLFDEIKPFLSENENDIIKISNNLKSDYYKVNYNTFYYDLETIIDDLDRKYNNVEDSTIIPYIAIIILFLLFISMFTSIFYYSDKNDKKNDKKKEEADHKKFIKNYKDYYKDYMMQRDLRKKQQDFKDNEDTRTWDNYQYKTTQPRKFKN